LSETERDSTSNSQYVEQLEKLLYDCIVELSYVQSVENCNSGLCATSKGEHLIELGMATLGVDDLSAETWEEVKRNERSSGSQT